MKSSEAQIQCPDCGTQTQEIFKWDVEDPMSHDQYSLEFQTTKHLQKRLCQRNFSKEIIQTVIDYGRAYFKQGLIFYVLGEKHDLEHLPIQQRKRFQNLVVVVSTDDASILTAYRSKNPFRHIKRKSKTLVSNKAA